MTASCAGCGASWNGQAPAHCSGCHQTFAGVTYFDWHRAGYKCGDPSAHGLVLADGMWRSDKARPPELNAA